jgi:hypothetical protein
LLRATQPLPGVALRFPHIDRSATRSPHGRVIKEFESYMLNSGTDKQKYKTINKFLIQGWPNISSSQETPARSKAIQYTLLSEVYSFVEMLSIKFVSYTVPKQGIIKDSDVKWHNWKRLCLILSVFLGIKLSGGRIPLGARLSLPSRSTLGTHPAHVR